MEQNNSFETTNTVVSETDKIYSDRIIVNAAVDDAFIISDINDDIIDEEKN